MHGDMPSGTDPDGTNFPGFYGVVSIQPDPGGPFHVGGFDPMSGKQFDDRVLQQLDILLQSQSQLFQVQDGIAHQLSGSMVSNIPSPVGLVISSLDLLQKLLPDQQVVLISALSQGIDMGMLTEQEILQGLGLSQGLPFKIDQPMETFLLVVPGFLVIDNPQVNKLNGSFYKGTFDSSDFK